MILLLLCLPPGPCSILVGRSSKNGWPIRLGVTRNSRNLGTLDYGVEAYGGRPSLAPEQEYCRVKSPRVIVQYLETHFYCGKTYERSDLNKAIFLPPCLG